MDSRTRPVLPPMRTSTAAHRGAGGGPPRVYPGRGRAGGYACSIRLRAPNLSKIPSRRARQAKKITREFLLSFAFLKGLRAAWPCGTHDASGSGRGHQSGRAFPDAGVQRRINSQEQAVRTVSLTIERGPLLRLFQSHPSREHACSVLTKPLSLRRAGTAMLISVAAPKALRITC